MKGPLPLRALCSIGGFALALAALPELEDVGPLALWVGALSGLGFSICALTGAAWVFDAPGPGGVRARTQTVWETASSCALAFTAASLSQIALATDGWAALTALAAVFAAWLGWADFPWELLEGRLPKPPGPERYDTAPAPTGEAPRPAPALAPGVEELLVAAGAFKVDRSRMVEVLSRFQTGDPEGFLLPWIRLAVASDATRLELSLRETGLEFHFDGRPLSPQYCSDPFAALAGEDGGEGETQRHKHLAWGLLNALPLSPRAVVGRSGSARLRLEPAGAAKTHWVDPDPRLGTALRVVFSGWDAEFKAERCLARAREAWGLCDATLAVDGKTVPAWEPRPGVGTRFAAGPVRGLFVRMEAAKSLHGSRIYWLGALVREQQMVTLPTGWSVRLTFEGLKVDASLAKVRADEAYRSAARRARAEFDRLDSAGGLDTGVLRPAAFTKPGLAAALGGAVLSFAAFAATDSARPDLAWAAGSAYVVTTAAMLWLLGRWTLARLSGRLNPFRG